VLSTPGSFVVMPVTVTFVLLELLVVFLFDFDIESILSKLLIFSVFTIPPFEYSPPL
jgi:hypothetical protein